MQIPPIKLIKGTLLLIWIPLIGCYLIVISGYNAWKLITFLPLVYLCYMKNPVLCLGMNWNSDHVSIFKMIWRDFSFLQCTIMLMYPSSLYPTYTSFQNRSEKLRKKRNLFYPGRSYSIHGIGPSKYTIGCSPCKHSNLDRNTFY